MSSKDDEIERKEDEQKDNKKEKEEEKEEEDEKEKGMTLKLGDIIEIRAPSNDLLHENTFFIDYIDEHRLVLIDVASLEETQLNKDEDMGFTDKSIQEIILVSRSELSGYARQNKLVPNTWIEIHIGGDVSTIITGEITSLEEDQIEIRTVPDLDVIYIDFEYKGLPSNIPIQKIVIRDKPTAYSTIDTLGDTTPDKKPSADEPHIEYLETGESIIHADEEAAEEENVIELLRTDVAKSKEVVFGEDLEEIEQYVELPESQKRYGIDLQTSSLLDELLSTIPVSKRTENIMSKIHTLIAHFRELRENFSSFDENGEIRNFRRNNPQFHKPLVERIQKMDTKIDWVLPVTSLKKKIYLTPEEKEEEITQGDTIPLLFDEVLNEEENIKKTTYFNDRTLVDESKYYKLYQQLEDLMKPFENPIDHPAYLNKGNVRTNLETIIENYDEFYSSVLKQSDIIKRKFVIQKYDLGLNRRTIQRNNNIETTPMTRPDTIFVKSMVLLPEPVVHWSRVRLPETSILEKTNIHHTSLMLFRLLHKNKDIVPFIIDDLEKDFYQDTDTHDTDGFLNDIRHYTLSDTFMRVNEDNRFEQFLQAMIPKTRTLIHLFRKYITQRLSFVSVVSALEPFQIYSSDITYKQYLEIRRFIMEQIENKKKNIEEQRKQFGSLSTHKFSTEPRVLSILQYLLERPEFLDQLIVGYQLPQREVIQKHFSTSEIIQKILAIDNGVLLTLLIQNLMSALKMPASLAELFTDSPIETMNQNEKIKATDCHRRVLTKKYESMTELQKDNGKDIYYDKEYDDTPYHLLDKYKEEKKKMLPDVFSRFLIENLIQKHDCPKEKAPELAHTMIRGKKEVAEGEFALLVLTPEITEMPESVEERRKLQDAASVHKKSTYYYRKNGVWIHHKEMDDEAFIDTADLFCNVKKDCMLDSSGPTSQCMSIGEMRTLSQSKIKGELNSRYELADEDTKATLQKRIAEHLRFLQRWMRIQSIKLERANNVAYQIGLEAAKYTDAVVSPHTELRNRILGQTDFVKKQHDIVRLYDQYCREPMELLTEDVGWKYCKMSNTKLLPAFLYELATTFVRGGDYAMKLEEICHTHGLLSDSGDAIVDKHSGFSVRAIDFAEETGYDESGFKITTHAFIQKGEVDKAVENILDLYANNAEKQVCEGERAQMICNILGGISAQIGHPLTDIRDFCVRISIALCDQLIDTEEKYAKEAKKAEEKKGIKLPPYKKRSQQLTLLITATILFMTIQTESPAFQPKKTMPGCVKSFKGFPLEGEEDTTGIQYIACVLSKMEKKMEPWNSLERMTVAMIQEQMKRIANATMKHAEMDERYLKKREYMVINESYEIPEELSLRQWGHFLPPLVPISISTGPVSPDFKDDLISTIKKGSKHQHTDMLVLKSRIAQSGFSIISAIQKIVENKDLLLVASSTGTPYLQNVCCNEKDKNPLLYFIEENPDIERFVKSARFLSALLKNIVEISKPAFLFDPRGRQLNYPPISSEITEYNLYSAFIHYCQLDKDKGVPSKFHAFFTDIPVGYPAKTSTEEKIEFLKRNGKRFTSAQFTELITIVHKENIVTIEKPTPYHRSEILKDIITLFDKSKSPVIDASLRENMFQVLNKYDKTKLVALIESGNSEDADKLPEPEKQKMMAIKKMKDDLAEMIRDTFKPSVLSFLKKYGKIGPTDFRRLTEFFDTFVTKWSNPDIYKTANFVKNAVYEMTSVFPNILITNITNVSRVHAYWGLAKVDNDRVYNSISNYYNPLGEFRGDKVIQKLLVYIQTQFVDLRMFFEHLPIHESIKIGSRDYFSFFDKDTIELLLEYVFLSVLHEYIVATDEPDLIRLEQVEKKHDSRARISTENDVDTQFHSEHTDLSEEYEQVYGDMMEIQINSGNRDELKTRIAKMLLTFINITRKNKSETDLSYENISAAIRKRKEKEKNRIVERFKNMSEDERKVEDMKKKLKMDEWNVGTQRGIFEYDVNTSTREVMEQQTEEQLDIQKHGIRQTDFIAIHGDTENGDPLREMVDIDEIPDETADEENLISGLASLKPNFFDGQFYSDDDASDDE